MKNNEQDNHAKKQPSTTGSLRDQVLQLKASERELTAALEHERSQRVALAQRYSGLEAQYTRLARFYVAAQRLLDAESREDVYTAIQDVVANLVGCEEVGIFRFDDQTRELFLVSSMGLDDADIGRIPVGSSLIGTTMLQGVAYFGGEAKCRLPQEADITACIPLRSKDRLFGAIATFRLLPQKPELSVEDRDLLSLLGRLSAVALLSTAACRPGTPMEESQ